MTKTKRSKFSTHRLRICACSLACLSCLSAASPPVVAADPPPPAPLKMPAAEDPALVTLIQRGDAILKTIAWHSTEGQNGSDTWPLMVGDQLLCSPTPGGVAGIDPTTGRIKWRARVGPAFYGDPSTVLMLDNGLRAANAWDGTGKWRLPLSPGVNKLGDADDGRVPVAVNLPASTAGAGAARGPAGGAQPDGPPELRLINIAAGEVIWKYPLTDATDARAIAAGPYVCLSVQQMPLIDGTARPRSQYHLLDANGKALKVVGTGLQRATLQAVVGTTAVFVGSGGVGDAAIAPQGQVVALDADTGKRLWSATLPITPDYSVSFPTLDAVVTDDLVLVTYASARQPDSTRGITAFDLRTGRQKWSLTDITKSSTQESMARFLQPLPCKDLVIVAVTHEDNNGTPLTQRQGLLALSAKTGQPQWLIHTGTDALPPTMDAAKLYFATAYRGATQTDLPTGIFAIPLQNIPPSADPK